MVGRSKEIVENVVLILKPKPKYLVQFIIYETFQIKFTDVLLKFEIKFSKTYITNEF